LKISTDRAVTVEKCGRHSMKTIEFVGPPGSGKTTIALRLAKALEAHGVNAELVDAKFFHSRKIPKVRLIKALAPAVRDFLRMLPIVVLTSRASLLETVKWNRVIRVLVRTILARVLVERAVKVRPSITILEPGYLMMLVNAGMYAPPVAERIWTQKRLRRIRSADFIVVFSISPEIASRRMEGRTRGRPTRMRTLDNEKQGDVIVRASALAKKCATVSGYQQSRIIEVETGRTDPDQIVEIILRGCGYG
jgi:thymidylate kinase